MHHSSFTHRLTIPTFNIADMTLLKLDELSVWLYVCNIESVILTAFGYKLINIMNFAITNNLKLNILTILENLLWNPL
jgi:hypothetical protein